MRFAREQIAVALMLGALAAGAVMPACVSDDSAAPTADGGAPLPQPDSSTPLPGFDATVPGTDGGTKLVDGGSPPQEEASVPDADAGPAPALVRFAWFVGGTGAAPVIQGGAVVLPPIPLDLGDGGGRAYDVCIAPHGTGAWVGPLLAKSSFAAGLHPFDVTKYFQVAPGHYDARIVSAGSTMCDLPDAGAPSGADDAGEGGAVDAGAPPSSDFTSLPPVVAGAAMTAVLVDPANPAASIADVFAFTDDTTTAAGKAKVRFVNVSESDVVTPNDAGPPSDADVGSFDAGVTLTGADFGIGGGILLTSLFTNVTAHAQIDPAATNGYREIDPLSGVDSTLTTVSGQEAQYTPFTTDSLTLPAGGILTAFYASEPGAGRLPVLVWCYDGQPSTTSALLTKCAHSDVVADSSGSYTRFGDFSADGLDRDVCVKYHSYGSYAGPLLAQSGIDGGTAIPAQFISTYFNLHGGFTFDARFVAAGAANCATAVAPDTTYQAFTGAGGGYTSLLLTGYAAVPDDAGAVPPYDAGPPPVFTDDAGDTIDAGRQPTSPSLTTLATSVVVIEDVEYDANNYAALRLVHVAAIHPQPITVTVSSGPVIITGQVVRPLSSSPWTLGDAPYGGFSTLPGPTDPWGYVPMTTNVLTIDLEQSEWMYTIDGDQTSMFAFDGEGGVQLLACDDYDELVFPANALYTSCCVVGAPNCGGNQVVPTAPSLRPASRHARHLVRALPTKR